MVIRKHFACQNITAYLLVSNTVARFQKFSNKMPLVVPGVTADNMGGGDKTQEWMNKLAGKKLSEQPTSETVSRVLVLPISASADDSTIRPSARRSCPKRRVSSSQG
jgi:hypothetical protein